MLVLQSVLQIQRLFVNALYVNYFTLAQVCVDRVFSKNDSVYAALRGPTTETSTAATTTTTTEKEVSMTGAVTKTTAALTRAEYTKAISETTSQNFLSSSCKFQAFPNTCQACVRSTLVYYNRTKVDSNEFDQFNVNR